MKSANTVMLPLVRKQNVFEPLPNSLATLTPHRNINTLDLIDANQTCSKVVKAETALDDVGPPLHIFNLQGYPKPPETPLQLPHAPLCSLTIGEHQSQELERALLLSGI